MCANEPHDPIGYFRPRPVVAFATGATSSRSPPAPPISCAES
jgi:hypothetical protein